MISFVLFITFFRIIRSENLSDSFELIRLAYSEPLTRFEALFVCKQELEGSFTSSYYLNDKAKNWIYDQLNSSNQEITFHRDLFNDSSYLVNFNRKISSKIFSIKHGLNLELSSMENF